MLNSIKSYVILKIILTKYLNDERKYKLVNYNKIFQKILNISLVDYKRFSGKYFIGEKNGEGKEYDGLNKQLIYEGEYKNGKRNGIGKEYNERGALIYKGEYLNGERNGIGKEYNGYQKLIYEGN